MNQSFNRMYHPNLKFTLGILFCCGLVSLAYGQIVLQRCDYPTNWRGSNAVSIDQADKKEGRGSLTFTGSGTDWFAKSFSQTHSGVDETGYLKFWLYVSDISAFGTAGQVEITSSGVPDADEYHWDVSTLGLSSGWNDVTLPISMATVQGTPDLNAIRYFRFYQPLNSSITAKIDFIRLTKSAEPSMSDAILDIRPVDNSTLDGKVMFGYQGWFGSPDDGSAFARWFHWNNIGVGSGEPADLSVDMWFDAREFDPDELYKTGYFYPDGSVARAFSSYNKKTVDRHMKWLRDYDLDGVMLQRFIYEVNDENLKAFRDTVTVGIMEGCERYGRVFNIMWDGLNRGETVADIKRDWVHLVDNIGVTESPAYLHHRGRPLISLWGYSVRSEAPVEDLVELIDFFHNNPEEKYRASVKVGCNQDWIYRSEWREAFKDVEVISPWAVGRYGNKSGYESFAEEYVIPAQEWCDDNNIDFMPVNWPGFSWYNLNGGAQNQHPRRGGDFFWEQAEGNISRGVKSLYIAMFDEIDESTAMFKLPENASQSPGLGYWLTLDADGVELPSDWYLRSAGLSTQVMRGLTDNRVDLGTPPEGLDVFTTVATHETCGSANGALTLGYPEDIQDFEFSIDGGVTYPFRSTSDGQSVSIPDLSEDLYDIWVRYTDGSFPTDLGSVLIVDAEPALTIDVSAASCLDNGKMNIRVFDNPYIGAVEISLDNGQTYPYHVGEGVYEIEIEDLAADTYEIWARWTDKGCPTSIGYFTVETDLPVPSANFMMGGVDLEDPACIGSTITAEASVDAEATAWQWSGPNGFSASTQNVLITDSLTTNEAGTYTAQYTNPDGCNVSTSIELASSTDVVPAIDFMIEFDGNYQDPAVSSFCEGDVLILEGFPEENQWTWTWSGPNNFRKQGRRSTLTGNASPDISGSYTLITEDENGCLAELSKELTVLQAGACVVAADQSFLEVATIYPNPTNGAITLVFSEEGITSLRLLSLNGALMVEKEVTNMPSVTLDLIDLRTGLYLIVLQGQNGLERTMKLIKK